MNAPQATEPPPLSPTSDSFPSRNTLATWPLLVWLLVQLAALLLAAARVPLAANYPRDAERLAVHLLLATQIVSAAALMPWLLRGWRSSLLAAACCWPPLAIAGMLSSLPLDQVFMTAGYVTTWIAALAVWRAAAPSRRVAHRFSAVASALAAGGPLLWYLRAEFASADPSTTGPSWHYGPVLTAFSLASGGPVSVTGWVVLLVLTAAGASLAWGRRRRASGWPWRPVPTPQPPPLSPTAPPLPPE